LNQLIAAVRSNPLVNHLAPLLERVQMYFAQNDFHEAMRVLALQFALQCMDIINQHPN
jgi:hypothetical protein